MGTRPCEQIFRENIVSTSTSRPRIVIYGVGQYGGFITRFAVQKGWPIVAAYNRAGPKIGQDLGRVAGLDRDIGVMVQDCEHGDYSAQQ
jgi:2,4-diaminopentanoate dehydrogenase